MSCKDVKAKRKRKEIMFELRVIIYSSETRLLMYKTVARGGSEFKVMGSKCH